MLTAVGMQRLRSAAWLLCACSPTCPLVVQLRRICRAYRRIACSGGVILKSCWRLLLLEFCSFAGVGV